MKTAAILFAVFILGVIVLADTGHLGFLHFVYDFPNGDKAGHFILYGILSFLVNLTLLRSFPSRPPRRVAVIVSLALAFAIGIEEWSQRFVPERTSDWVDLACSYTGMMVGALLAWRNNRKRA